MNRQTDSRSVAEVPPHCPKAERQLPAPATKNIGNVSENAVTQTAYAVNIPLRRGTHTGPNLRIRAASAVRSFITANKIRGLLYAL